MSLPRLVAATLAFVIGSAMATTLFWAADTPPDQDNFAALTDTAGLTAVLGPDELAAIDATGIGPRARQATPTGPVDPADVRTLVASRSVTDDGRPLTIRPSGDDELLIAADDTVLSVAPRRVKAYNDRRLASTAVAFAGGLAGAAVWLLFRPSGRGWRVAGAGVAPYAAVALAVWALTVWVGNGSRPGVDQGSGLVFSTLFLAPVWLAAGAVTATVAAIRSRPA